MLSVVVVGDDPQVFEQDQEFRSFPFRPLFPVAPPARIRTEPEEAARRRAAPPGKRRKRAAADIVELPTHEDGADDGG